jgi:hypothetical protein
MATYKRLLDSLLDYCKQRKVKVDFVPESRLRDYAGMNPEIGHVLGFTIPRNTIMIDESISDKDKYETLLHEMYEWGLMKKGMDYWDAHCRALAIEKRTRVSVPYKPSRKMQQALAEIRT